MIVTPLLGLKMFNTNIFPSVSQELCRPLREGRGVRVLQRHHPTARQLPRERVRVQVLVSRQAQLEEILLVSEYLFLAMKYIIDWCKRIIKV